MEIIHTLDHSEIHLAKELLLANSLPVSDLDDAPIQFFGIKEKNRLIAIGALEIYDDNALVRSVAVHQTHRNLGYGKQIVRYLEKKAIELKINKLFLLTTTAKNFFNKLDCISIQRDLCPPEILSSGQFRDICPKSASCLFKNLKD